MYDRLVEQALRGSTSAAGGPGDGLNPLLAGIMFCACGWLLPRADSLIVTVESEPYAPVTEYKAGLELSCPHCGVWYELSSMIPRVLN